MRRGASDARAALSPIPATGGICIGVGCGLPGHDGTQATQPLASELGHGRTTLPRRAQIGSGAAFIRSIANRLVTLRSGNAPISLR